MKNFRKCLSAVLSLILIFGTVYAPLSVSAAESTEGYYKVFDYENLTNYEDWFIQNYLNKGVAHANVSAVTGTDAINGTSLRITGDRSSTDYRSFFIQDLDNLIPNTAKMRVSLKYKLKNSTGGPWGGIGFMDTIRTQDRWSTINRNSYTENNSPFSWGLYSSPQTVNFEIKRKGNDNSYLAIYFSTSDVNFDMIIDDLTVAEILTDVKAVSSNDNMGSVTVAPASGFASYAVNDTATFTATPKEGYDFYGWYDENNTLLSTDATFGYQLKGNTTLTARFDFSTPEEKEYFSLTYDYEDTSTNDTNTWLYAANTTNVGSSQISADMASTGSHSLKITAPATDRNSLWFNLVPHDNAYSVTKGNQYKISADIYLPTSGCVSTDFKVGIANGLWQVNGMTVPNNYSCSISPKDGWQKLTGILTASDSNWANAYAWTKGTFYIDNLQINQIIENVTAISEDINNGTASVVPKDGTAAFAKNDIAVFTATPKDGYSFNGWYYKGECVSRSEVYERTVTTDTTLVARFVYGELQNFENYPAKTNAEYTGDAVLNSNPEGGAYSGTTVIEYNGATATSKVINQNRVLINPTNSGLPKINDYITSGQKIKYSLKYKVLGTETVNFQIYTGKFGISAWTHINKYFSTALQPTNGGWATLEGSFSPTEAEENYFVLFFGGTGHILVDDVLLYKDNYVETLSSYNGNAIRTTGNQGLRFKFTIDKAFINDTDSEYRVVEYGILASRATTENVVIDGENVVKGISYKKGYNDEKPSLDIHHVKLETETHKVVTAALYNIGYNKATQKTDYSRYSDDYKARLYVIRENADGVQVVNYGEVRKANINDTVHEIFTTEGDDEGLLSDKAAIKTYMQDEAEKIKYYLSKYPDEYNYIVDNIVEDIGGTLEGSNTLKMYKYSSETGTWGEPLPESGNFYYAKANWASVGKDSNADYGAYSLRLLTRNQGDASIGIKGLKKDTRYAVRFDWNLKGRTADDHFNGMVAVPFTETPQWDTSVTDNLGGYINSHSGSPNWNEVYFEFYSGDNTDVTLNYNYYATAENSYIYFDNIILYELPNQEKYKMYTIRTEAENGFALKNTVDLVENNSEVKLIAMPKSNTSTFEGWYKNNETVPFTTEREVNVTVTETVKYTAKFAEVADTENKGINKPVIDGDTVYDMGEVYTKQVVMEQIVAGTYKPFFERSIANKGNTALIANVLRKAKKGEEITIGALGGSITQGAGVETPAKSYSALVKDWFVETFPNAKVNYVNAGIGATSSLLGIARIDEHLLSTDANNDGVINDVDTPDLVIVDFTVNDGGLSYNQYSYEAVIHTLLEKNIAAMAIMFTNVNNAEYGKGVYHWGGYSSSFTTQLATLKYYDVPTINYGPALWINYMDADGDFYNTAGDLAQWTEMMYDYIHPNWNGHTLAANALKNIIQNVYENLENENGTYTLPEEYFREGTDYYYGAKMYKHNTEGIDTLFSSSDKVTIGEYGNVDANTIFHWEPWDIEEGGYIEFKIPECKNFNFYHVKNSELNGVIRVYINGKDVANISNSSGMALNWNDYIYYGDGISETTVRLECVKGAARITCVNITQ